ncbi:hypothetical protein [Aeromonas sp. HMWF015]|uniref:hypothetical protein n=2 Tax=Aeromonas sp. HMWF015 TaxID=2056851 RepID=UPI00267EEF15
MRKCLLVIMLTSFISGCAVSYDPSTSSKATQVDFPPLGQVSTVYVGDSMMSKGILVEGEAVVLKNSIDGVAYDIPSGTYDKLGSNNTADVFKTATREGQIVIQNPFADPYQALGVKKNNPNELCVVTVFGMYSCYAANFEIKKVSSFNSASFQQTLIYSGKVGNKINIGYRETSHDMARPAFNNDVEYYLGESQEIGYKGAVVEVISADNQKITYRVVKSFR